MTVAVLGVFVIAVGVAQAQARPDEAPVVEHSAVWRADAAVQRRLQAWRASHGDTARAVSRGLNSWGGTGVIVFAATLWLGGRLVRRRDIARVGLRGVEALAVASAISGVIKGLTGRARPFLEPAEPWHWDFNHGWTDARYFSMPSGHTTATMAFAVGAAIAAWRLWRGGGAAFGIACLASAVAVGAARLYADQHWLTDVIAAAVLGAGTAVVLARVHAGRRPSGYDRVLLGRDAGDAAASPGVP